jgi:universal stress protein A
MKLKLTARRAGRSALRQPQLTATPRSGLQLRRILVPTDFSGAAAQALRYAVPLARTMGAKIVLLHVIEPVYAGAEPGMGYMPQQTEAQTASAKNLMREIATEWVPKELFEKAVLRTGSPFHEIASAAQSLKADLIVITTHGRTGLNHVLMGSTAERVVRHAGCPVLTVRRDSQ